MKTSYSDSYGRREEKSYRRKLKPVIPFARSDKKDLGQGEYVVIKCRVEVGNPQSPQYELRVPYFRDGTPEEWLEFKQNLDKALKGQVDSPKAADMFGMARRLLEGETLSTFELETDARKNVVLDPENGPVGETKEVFEEVMKEITRQVFPKRAVQTQKRFLRRFLKKPDDMRTRQFVSRALELNSQFVEYPEMVKGEPNTCIPKDEMLDLLEFTMPPEYQSQMVLQGFDPLMHSVKDFIDFCERLESLDKTSMLKRYESKSKSSNSINRQTHEKYKIPKKQGHKRKRDDREYSEKYCMLHGYGNHTTEQCYTVKKRLEISEKSHKNKALDDKYQKARKRDKQEANAIIKRFLKYQDREKSSQSKRSLEIKNFENLSISDSEHDENDENNNADDNKVEENVDEDNNSIHSACSSSSGDTVE